MCPSKQVESRGDASDCVPAVTGSKLGQKPPTVLSENFYDIPLSL